MGICIGGETVGPNSDDVQNEGLNPTEDDNTGVCLGADPCANIMIEGSVNNFTDAYHKRKNAAGDKCLCVCTNPGGVVCNACDGYFKNVDDCGCYFDQNITKWNIVDGECVKVNDVTGQYCTKSECEDVLAPIIPVNTDCSDFNYNDILVNECCFDGDRAIVNGPCEINGERGVLIKGANLICTCTPLVTGCQPFYNPICGGISDKETCDGVGDCSWIVY